MAATLREIANYSGVSIATASMALNNKPVNEKTRIRVIGAAKRLGYRPSALARGLRTNKTYTLGLTMCSPNLELISAIVKTAQDRNYHIITQIFTQYDLKEEVAAFESLLMRRVDGVLVWPTEDGLDYSSQIEKFRQQEIPVVMVDRHIAGIKVHSFLLDNRRGAMMGWKHLWSLGRKPIVYLDFDCEYSSILSRRQGVTDGHLATGTKWDDKFHLKVLGREGLNQALIRQAIEAAKGGGAIFAAADHIAFAVIRLARKMKIAIPDDLALIGFEDIVIWLNERVGWTTSPPLSTVRMNFGEVGQRATNFLIDLLDDKIDTTSEEYRDKVCLVEPQLVVRESCGGQPGIYGPDEVGNKRFLGSEEI
jgi:LacI family transcriptional regulator